MVGITDYFRHVVLQPTTLCNLDCRYCYLPLRKASNRMSVEVVAAIARSIEEQDLGRSVEITWHGGEPLAGGVDHFRRLLAPFEYLEQSRRVVYGIQTNGTLINDEWCDLFARHRMNVGVSIDGPEWMTGQRVDLGGRSVHAKIMRGIGYLRTAGIPFSTIAVVNSTNIGHPRELYQFFCELGSHRAGFNIEEMEGVNTSADVVSHEAAFAFWKGIFEAWSADPRLPVRELNKSLSFVHAVLNDTVDTWNPGLTASFPTVMWNGDVVLLSPELAGSKSDKYGDFLVGNVLQTSLVEIVRCGRDSLYVRDYVEGVRKCQAACPYFTFCKGGMASNKFQEHGTTNATETDFCRNTKQRLLDAVIQ